jgi:hypothetical protein
MTVITNSLTQDYVLVIGCESFLYAQKLMITRDAIALACLSEDGLLARHHTGATRHWQNTSSHPAMSL